MLQIDDFLVDVDTEEPRPSKFQLENAVTTYIDAICVQPLKKYVHLFW